MSKTDEYIKISNPNKILYKKDNITKLDVINYYISISKYMFPFVKNRLLSVIRCHNEKKDECFYKKHPTNDIDYVEKFEDDKETYFYIKNINQLIYQAQLGTLEFHTWGSSIPKINKPDQLILDLDPDENLSLKKLRDAVKKVKSVLDELNLESFLKTSGGKGYHIVVPIICETWNILNEFAKNISTLIENKWKNIFTTNIRKIDRKGKIFIDYLRNGKGSTCVAPYSLRSRNEATISMPISWDNLNKISPKEVTIINYKKYLNNSWNNFFKINQKIK